MKELKRKTKTTIKRKSLSKPTTEGKCEHGLPFLQHDGEKLCALEYLNRFVAPHRVERVTRRSQQLFLVFDTGDRIECCCEACGQGHGDDHDFLADVREMALGRRALRFRMEPTGHVAIWFARGDHLHLHRNSLERFRPHRQGRSLRPAHTVSTHTVSTHTVSTHTVKDR